MERARAWLESARRSALAELVAVPGGAGAARYYRARFADGSSAIFMHALPEDAAILPPQLRVSAGEIAFLEVRALLARHGIPVPEIYAVERAERWVLLEDLGDTHLLDLDPRARAQRFAESVELLARVHALPREEALPFRRAFDAEWARFELRTFAEHGAREAVRAAPLPELDPLAPAVAGLPHVCALRRYRV